MRTSERESKATGLQTEFNWYIVLTDNNFLSPEIRPDVSNGSIDMETNYFLEKPEYRIYPMDTPLPVIYNGNCLAMMAVSTCSWKGNKTQLTLQPVITFVADDPAAMHYESLFAEYQRQQATINDGGKVDLRNVANLSTRRRF